MALFSLSALAQVTEIGGNGFKAGDARVHPYIELESRYDSAAGFVANPGDVVGAFAPEMVAHIRPGVRVESRSDTLGILFDGNLDYVRYTGLLSPGLKEPSRLDAAANLNLAFNRDGPAELDVVDHLSRSSQTSNVAVTVGLLSLLNELQVNAPLRPGSGALELIPKAAFAVEYFEPLGNFPVSSCSDVACGQAVVHAMDYRNFRAGAEGKWKFLPKTALTFEPSLDARDYFRGSDNPPARLFKVTAGLLGLVTAKTSVVLKAGWGHDFGASQASAVLANIEGTYFIRENDTLKLGYLRSLEPVPGYGTFGDDRVYLEGRHLLWSERLFLRLYAAYDHLRYSGGAVETGSAALQSLFPLGRRDDAFVFQLGPEYPLVRWALASVGYQLSLHQSNVDRAASLAYSSANYTRHEAYVRVNFNY